MISFETDIRIERSIDEVFAYVSDPLNFPRWNSAVRAVRRTSTGEKGLASTYLMERELPAGRALNELEVSANEQAGEFAIRTRSGPTPFHYLYRFSAENSGTLVQLDAQVDLQDATTFVPQLARRAVKKGVDDNLASLKVILEAAMVS